MAVEPPEVEASATEPPEASGVSIYELFIFPDEVMENISESLVKPVLALEANQEISVLSVMVTKTAFELLGSLHTESDIFVCIFLYLSPFPIKMLATYAKTQKI